MNDLTTGKVSTPRSASNRTVLAAPAYDLTASLTSGQAFRWQRAGEAWEGVVDRRWVRLRSVEQTIEAETIGPQRDWAWLENYLQINVDLEAILKTFPHDEPMRQSVAACRGLRLLRQEPWECLATFILSSTKQIVQIQQIVGLLCARFGSPVPVPDGHGARQSFPAPEVLARLPETELRACKMGFRAPHLLAAARRVAEGHLNLPGLSALPLPEAREQLVALPGVGPKIANCVLLFACGFPQAFPVDVWVMKALRELYFPKRRPRPQRLQKFVAEYFGPNAGYAQQYLFHYMRTLRRRVEG